MATLFSLLFTFYFLAATDPRAGVSASSDHATSIAIDSASDAPLWAYPVHPPQFGRLYVAPATEYGPGHRGLDFRTSPGARVTAPTDATVFFVGVVAEKPVLTLEDDAGRLISFEPIESDLARGEQVSRDTFLGVTAVGGHCAASCVHVGVRVTGNYVNPLPFFVGKPRLLPHARG